jgi:alpha-N-arabinofuranosidase
LAVCKRDGKYFLVLKYKLGRLKHTEKEFELKSPVVLLRIRSTNKDSYCFEWGGRPDGYVPLGEIDTGFLSSETAGGFTGVYLALYAQSSSDGGAAGGHADFDDFLYMNHEVPERP